MAERIILFEQRLKELREQKALTQKQLGESLGVIKQAVWNWEQGKAAPNLPLLIRLAEALEVSLDYLVGRTDEREDI